jgi:flagellar hook-associated protein 1 FlgK
MVAGSLGIGVTGLDAARQALDIISHNIANANTEGYSRQQISFVSQESTKSGVGYIGNGVSVSEIRRITDDLVTKNLQVYTASYNQYEAYSTEAVTIEKLLADEGSSISKGMTAFFVSLQQANANPQSIPVRQSVVNSAKDLVSKFNNLNTQLNNLNNSINQQLDELVTKINDLTTDIAAVNQRIVDYSSSGTAASPNDLLDRRDTLIKKLSEITNVSTSKQSNGSLNVFLNNGIAVVVGSSTLTLQTKLNDSDASRKEIAMNSNGTTHEITAAMAGGKIGGLLNMRDEILEPTFNGLGQIAISLANTLNQQNKLGIDLNGDLGLNLFNDVNAAVATQSRAMADSDNTGSASVSVSINDIPRKLEPPYTVYGAASTLINVSTGLDSLSTGELKLNGVSVRATVSGDDTLSTTNNAASAIATAAAINAGTSQHHVTATVQKNVLYLGAFTAGAFSTGDFNINGSDIISAGTNETVLLQDINALTATTGVKAFGDGSGNITLVAEDGRNIRLTSDTSTQTATFSLFDTASATALDKVQRAGVTLSSTVGAIAITGSDPAEVGLTTGTTPDVGTSLTTSNYELTYNGTTYTLKRLSDNTTVASGTGTTLTADGITVSISGTMATTDKFTIKPTRFAINEFSLNITDAKKLALASPVSAAASSANSGSGSLAVTKVLDTDGLTAPTDYKLGNAFATPDALGPPLRIVFTSATTYKLYNVTNGSPGTQIGPEMTYDPTNGTELFPMPGVVDTTTGGPNAPFTWDPGYRAKITGIVATGDVFTLSYNTNPSGDNRNGLQLAAMQFEKMMGSQTMTYTDIYANLIGDIGSNTGLATSNMEASKLLLQAIENKRASISGVDLDEEAANLIKFQQAYQAAAQVIAISRSTFDMLISAVGGS